VILEASQYTNVKLRKLCIGWVNANSTTFNLQNYAYPILVSFTVNISSFFCSTQFYFGSHKGGLVVGEEEHKGWSDKMDMG